jgi:GDP-4-dehydro-6-deoxy-D-mannose reductase
VFHLAALASVARSWRSPGETLVTNVQVTVNLLEAVRTEAPEAGVVVASSGAACDLLAGQYADAFGIRIVRTRAFNHAGPGQSDDYVVGTLTRQVAEAEAAGTAEVVLRTGNPDSARDFTDVRDVVRAYRAAAELPAGVYNLCSGRATSVRHLVELVRRATSLPVRHEIDPDRLRAHDVPELRGSAERLRAASGWRPEIPLERTVADALEVWRRELGG